MFKNLIKIFKKEDLLSQAFGNALKMLRKDKKMFENAIDALFENEKLKIDIYKEDKKVNRYEIDIRSKIVKHLAINPNPNISAAMVLSFIVREIERIGDYAKNIAELADMYDHKVSELKYFNELDKTADEISVMFDKTISALESEDKEIAQDVSDMHNKKIKKRMDEMIALAVVDSKISAKRAAVTALTSRYLKRISAHLMDVASAVINPLDMVGFEKEKYQK